MPRKSETVGGISDPYEDLNILKSMYLPLGYIKYLERLRASSDERFASLTHMVKFALGQTFPTPHKIEDEETFVKETFNFNLNNELISASGISPSGPEKTFKPPQRLRDENNEQSDENEPVYIYGGRRTDDAKLFLGKVYRKDGGKKIRLDVFRVSDTSRKIFSHEFVFKDYDGSATGRESFTRGIVELMRKDDMVISGEKESEDMTILIDELLVAL